ncbi:MAG: MFS transporter [Spirochaetaceae bacterium]
MKAASNPEDTRFSSTRLLIAISFLAFIILGLPDGLLGVSWPSISRSFGKALSRLAVLQAALTCGFFFSSINAGKLSDRFRVGTLLIGSTILISLALTGYALVDRWYLLVGSTVVLGLGAGTIDAGLNAYAAKNFSKEQVTLLHGFYGIGAMLGPMLMREVLRSGGSWRYGYFFALLLVLILLATFVLFRKKWTKPEKPRDLPPKKGGRGKLDLTAWLGILLFLIYTGVEVSVGIWSFTLLTAGRGVEDATAALWVGAFWAAFTGGRLFFGLFGKRWNSRSIIGAMILTSVAGALLLLQPWCIPAAFISLPILGFAAAPMFPLFVTLTPAVAGSSYSSHIIGYQVAASNIGAALIPLMIGAAVDLFSLEAIAYMVAILTGVLALLYKLWVRRGK